MTIMKAAGRTGLPLTMNPEYIWPGYPWRLPPRVISEDSVISEYAEVSEYV